ncbi:MAG: hypothetical protein KF841_16070 [Phycisphaerae bacterium]|nr:hypothetical protein [Phycisphaerae bacterium]
MNRYQLQHGVSVLSLLARPFHKKGGGSDIPSRGMGMPITDGLAILSDFGTSPSKAQAEGQDSESSM